MRQSEKYLVLGEASRLSRILGNRERRIGGVLLSCSDFVGTWKDAHQRLALPFQLETQLHSKKPSLDRFRVRRTDASRLTYLKDENGAALTQLDIGGVDGKHAANIQTKFQTLKIKDEVLGVKVDETMTAAVAIKESSFASFWRNSKKLAGDVMGWDPRGVRMVGDTDSYLGETFEVLNESMCDEDGKTVCLPLCAYPQAEGRGHPTFSDRRLRSTEGYLLMKEDRLPKSWWHELREASLLEAKAANEQHSIDFLELKRRVLALDVDAWMDTSPISWNIGLPPSRQHYALEVKSDVVGDFVCTVEQLRSVLTDKEAVAFKGEFLKKTGEVWGERDLGPKLPVVMLKQLFSDRFIVRDDEAVIPAASTALEAPSSQEEERFDEVRAAG